MIWGEKLMITFTQIKGYKIRQKYKQYKFRQTRIYL